VDWIHLADSGYGPLGGSCEHGNETLVSIKCVEFICYQSDY
jgi:hypothetical protein